jgi:4,5-dihydroxyphthalate decarboxylase
MKDKNIKLACWDYDRTLAVIDGRVRVKDWCVKSTVLPPEDLFPKVISTAPFDITEMSLSSYLMQLDRGEGAYIAIPAFVSRAFRHGGIYVRNGAGINTPRDLEGCLVGVPEYQMTMALWVRGIMQDEYGVDLQRLRYRTGGNNKPGRFERLKLNLPKKMDVQPIAEKETLNGLLLEKKIDAIIAPSPPDSFLVNNKGTIRQLFNQSAIVEQDYYTRTGLFPIMHVIGIRRSLVSKNPGLAAEVFRSFVEARALAIKDLEKTARASSNRITLPWFACEWERTKALMGSSPWPYGVKENLNELETVLRYSNEQYLTRRKLSIDELFAQETLNMLGT